MYRVYTANHIVPTDVTCRLIILPYALKTAKKQLFLHTKFCLKFIYTRTTHTNICLSRHSVVVNIEIRRFVLLFGHYDVSGLLCTATTFFILRRSDYTFMIRT